jgi:hypothetical protein
MFNLLILLRPFWIILRHNWSQLVAGQNIVLSQTNGVPVKVKDIANVRVGYLPRLGEAGRDRENDSSDGALFSDRAALVSRRGWVRTCIRGTITDATHLHQTARPRVNFPGAIAEAMFEVEGDRIVLFDLNGNKIGQREIVGTQTPKEAPAVLWLRNTIGNRRSDFNRPLHYPKLVYWDKRRGVPFSVRAFRGVSAPRARAAATGRKYVRAAAFRREAKWLNLLRVARVPIDSRTSGARASAVSPHVAAGAVYYNGQACLFKLPSPGFNSALGPAGI